ncbi:hypothetical protein H920_00102 [Fukomys damarensis]|uniref:Uncharacterized protein n=1 Tax=Fukomys damarensis TaxID=885580 RepID=A0A091E6Q1_FUKDA|nr:hypothetical protein H920_00102 [Fukomys damarensis]
MDNIHHRSTVGSRGSGTGSSVRLREAGLCCKGLWAMQTKLKALELSCENLSSEGGISPSSGQEPSEVWEPLLLIMGLSSQTCEAPHPEEELQEQTETVGGTLEDDLSHKKPTTQPALREEIENACVEISLIKVTQTAVHHTNKCLETKSQHMKHQARASSHTSLVFLSETKDLSSQERDETFFRLLSLLRSRWEAWLEPSNVLVGRPQGQDTSREDNRTKERTEIPFLGTVAPV